MKTRVAIGELTLGRAASVAGRVVGHFDDGRSTVLRDATGEMRLHLPPGATAPPIGALVTATGRFEKHGFVAEQLEVATLPAPREGELPESFEWADPSWPARRARLLERDRLLRALRDWFHGERFVEVETPTLLRAPGQEPHLLPFATKFHGNEAATPLWLATSPEYAMKRLLANGLPRIVQLGRSYRDGRDEHSPLHSPEFTMAEWYRAWDDLAAIGRDVEEVMRAAALELRGSTLVERGGGQCDLARPAVWLPVEQAFRELAQVALEPYLDGDDAAFVAALPTSLPRVGDTAREQADSAFFRLLVERVEPRLGVGRATLLCRYPARHAALSELAADDARVAQRFEAYVLGVELCNAFQELRDAAEQERRLLAEQAERVRLGGEKLPISQEFLRALRGGLPPCAGVALGVDRLHLVVSGAARVDDLQPFPFDGAR